jgi:hypothetical protein
MKIRTSLAVLLAAGMMCSTTLVVTTAVAALASENGPFQVINYNSGLCLDVAHASTDDGEEILQYGCHRGANQLWHFISDPNGSPHFHDGAAPPAP